MGFNPLKKIAKGFKKLVTNPGKWAENAGRSVGAATRDVAKFVPLPVPGLNSALAAVGSVAAGGNMKDHLGAGLSAAIPGALKSIPGAGNAIGSIAGKIPGLDRAGDLLGKLPGAQGISSILGQSQALPDSIVPMGEGGGGGISGLLGQAGGWLTGNSGKNALGLAQGVNTVLQQKKANDLAKSALRGAESEYAEAAPLRAQGLSGLLNPQTQDLSALRSMISTGNPYGG